MRPLLKHIILIITILIVCVLFVDNSSATKPQSIGEPLELLIVKGQGVDAGLYNELLLGLLVDIGPSPQQENSLSIVSIKEEDFKGILKRHQNICLFYKGPEFAINTHKDVFAEDQVVSSITFSSLKSIIENKEAIRALEQNIKNIEQSRLTRKFIKNNNKVAQDLVYMNHAITLTLPGDFFVAHSDDSCTWLRRETPKLSQGILIINSPKVGQKSTKQAISIIDTSLKDHVGGAINESFMATERRAPLDTCQLIIGKNKSIRIQSLWKMENDFMGGIYVAYIFANHIIYTYLYAPNQNKSIYLNQLEAVIKTLV